jgi:hypothetical protein
LQNCRIAGLQEGTRKNRSIFLTFLSAILQFCNPAIIEKVLISACLLGERVRYHGGDARLDHPILLRWREQGRLVRICPEEA